MPEVIGYYNNKPDGITYIKDWDKTANDWIPMTEDKLRKVDELEVPGARCPNIPPVNNVEELLPSLQAVAKRPYSGGSRPAWDLKRGEKGYGSPILRERKIKIQRMPFIVPEAVVSKCHTLPADVLVAIDEWTWKRIRACKRVHITDPEGTDIRYTNHDAYWNDTREFYRRDHVEKHYSSNVPYGETYHPGHIRGRPPFFIPQEDGEGVIKGTMSHIAPYPRMEMVVKNSVITDIKGGGIFGQKLRQLGQAVGDVQYSAFNKPDWSAIGMSIYIFPRTSRKMFEGEEVTIIENGRLKALDGPGVRAIAAKYGDPDELFHGDWIPVIPGLNIAGDYNEHYAKDLMDFTMMELDLCRKYHPLFQQMIAGRAKGGKQVNGDDSCCH
ncbi:hypothetical protein LTR93_011928 [Exophiala xenobiotica]|nr:hypothetical protein LTR93_011928 [Exophiala xenobiotica]